MPNDISKKASSEWFCMVQDGCRTGQPDPNCVGTNCNELYGKRQITSCTYIPFYIAANYIFFLF